MSRALVLILLTLAALHAYPATGGLDIENLSADGKKFFMDMTKQVMGVPSLKPENLAAQSFFRSFLDKYTKLDDKTKRDMEQHVPTATKIFNEAAKKYNVDPHKAFQMLSTFFENFKKGVNGNIAQQGMKMAGNLFGKKQTY
uniref:Protein C10 n=2 Tax=Angiostrongylus cantonensis TaxID=6313 RepID=A0A158PBS4_ANGCA